ncbi:hypothetical protein ppKF707_5124 [Metapseudomonas furukawaii]|uniref:Uncharacterized protein n=1 Tax=Metapseudomonas furukawaii TaxID=1149133 RepID=A0AAD1FH47_METFU|nr:hypothetical protein ppKF707_5124 [Pseudomonas furukawaii]BAU75882.1 hypothetical protein KF707C_41940 [Pseudomonas furukawaii]
MLIVFVEQPRRGLAFGRGGVGSRPKSHTILWYSKIQTRLFQWSICTENPADPR